MSLYASMQGAADVLGRDEQGKEVVAIVEGLLKSCRSPPKLQELSQAPHPVIVLEGLDGVGKSTLTDGLRSRLGEKTQCLRSPPEELQPFRKYFDMKPPALRRSFYLLGNYACTVHLRQLVQDGPVILDRFWPSTMAYSIACDQETEPVSEVVHMPLDLQDMLPSNPFIWLLLELPEEERADRVHQRALKGIAITEEEKSLEKSRELRERLTCAYHALRIGEEKLVQVNAAGAENDVLLRVEQVILSKVQELKMAAAPLIPKSVNWHYTRQCNYSCKFCFHTAKSSFFLPRTEEGMKESKECLSRLQLCGMEKVNFSGGEPFLQAKELGELVRFCKVELKVSVSIVSNGSLIKRSWMKQYGKFLDIIAISCDSFNEETNMKIGRGKGAHINQLYQIKEWCHEFEVGFKINSVINAHNVHEDMSEALARLQPMRWKVFQCLLIDGENAGEDALRDAQSLTIPDKSFQEFLERHADIDVLVPESNLAMKNSYLILDENMCFLNCTGGAKRPSPSIRKVSVSTALAEAGFDEEEFVKRGGIYDWELKGSTDIEDLGRESSQMQPSKAQKHGLNAKATGKTQAPLPNGKAESPEFGSDWYGDSAWLLLGLACGSLGLLAMLHRKL